MGVLGRAASPVQEPVAEQPESNSLVSASTGQLLLSRSASYVSRTFVNTSQLSTNTPGNTPTGSRHPSPGRVMPTMQGPSMAWKSSPPSVGHQYLPVHGAVSIHTPAVHVHGSPTVWAQSQHLLGVKAQAAPVHAMPRAW